MSIVVSKRPNVQEANRRLVIEMSASDAMVLADELQRKIGGSGVLTYKLGEELASLVCREPSFVWNGVEPHGYFVGGFEAKIDGETYCVYQSPANHKWFARTGRIGSDKVIAEIGKHRHFDHEHEAKQAVEIYVSVLRANRPRLITASGEWSWKYHGMFKPMFEKITNGTLYAVWCVSDTEYRGGYAPDRANPETMKSCWVKTTLHDAANACDDDAKLRRQM